MSDDLARPADANTRMRPWSALRNRNFALLWTGETVSTFGDQIFPVAVTIAALNAGANATELGIILAARLLSLVLFALIGGVWADRLPRRVVMMSADVVRGVTVLCLALLPHQPVWVLMLLVFIVGAGEAFFHPAENALIPSLLTKELLPPANALNSITFRAMTIIGPALGGVIVATAGVHWAYFVDVCTFAVSFGFVWFVREPMRAMTSDVRDSTFLADLADGFKELRRHVWAVAVIASSAILIMCVFAPQSVLLPIVSRSTFHTTTVYTLSLAAMGVGGIIGAIVASSWVPRRTGLVSLILGLLFAAVPLALAFASSRYVIMAAYFVGGFGFEPFNVWWVSAIQKGIDPDKLARVSSIDWMASFALFPLGLALTGPATQALGLTTVLVAGAIILVVASLAVLFVPGVMTLSDDRLALPEPSA